MSIFVAMARTSVLTALSRVVIMAVSFATVPIALHYLSQGQYGLWMAATSLVTMMLSFADGGLANGAVTAVAKALQEKGNAGVRQIIASAYLLLFPIAFGVVLLAVLACYVVPWDWVFNLSSPELTVLAGQTVLVVMISLAFGMLVNIVLRVRWGLQHIRPVLIWDTLAALMTLPAMFYVIHYDLGMVALVSAVVLTPIAVKAIGVLWYFILNPGVSPTRDDASLAVARKLLGAGSVFIVITLSQAVSVQSDQIIIANLIGVDAVAPYAVLNRLFTTPYILANFVLIAMWPTISNLNAQGNTRDIRPLFYRILLATSVFALIFSALLWFFVAEILQLWVGDKIKAEWSLVLGMAFYASILVVVGCYSTLFVSLDLRRWPIIMNLAMMVVNLALTLYLIPILGSAGAIWGTSIAYFVCLVLPSVGLAWWWFRKEARSHLNE